MKKRLFAVLVLGILAGMPAYAVEVTPEHAQPPIHPAPGEPWYAYAASSGGRVFLRKHLDEDTAKAMAERECIRQAGPPCNSIAVERITRVYVAQCEDFRGQMSFLGGSNRDMGGAKWWALEKARLAGYTEDECTEAAKYPR